MQTPACYPILPQGPFFDLQSYGNMHKVVPSGFPSTACTPAQKVKTRSNGSAPHNPCTAAAGFGMLPLWLPFLLIAGGSITFSRCLCTHRRVEIRSGSPQNPLSLTHLPENINPHCREQDDAPSSHTGGSRPWHHQLIRPPISTTQTPRVYISKSTVRPPRCRHCLEKRKKEKPNLKKGSKMLVW